MEHQKNNSLKKAYKNYDRNYVPKHAAPKPKNGKVRGGEMKKSTPSGRLTAGNVIMRILICVVTLLLYLILALYLVLFVICRGPSETVRDSVVLSAEQASATKWAPRLFLSKKTVDTIIANSKKTSTDTVDINSFSGGSSDEWSNAVDGMLFYTVKNSKYKAYVLIIKDPSRVFTGVSSDDFKTATEGMRFVDMAKKYDAIALINGGEFSDTGGTGNGAHPIGLTYSQGNCVWSDGSKRTFIGFTKDNKLVVADSMTKAQADSMGIRDSVSFQEGNVLITNDGGKVILHKSDDNTGRAQRSAIGQRKDGAVIMIVTDGRTASSLGATHNDMIDLMVHYGAITAGNLDGGSSVMMYYENYYDKYDYDVSTLDQYQKLGLVNTYKAFTNPRRIPTYFIVSKEK
jgi:exopolysaccharide biosynthesis protein